jgi:hypothetical protein
VGYIDFVRVVVDAAGGLAAVERYWWSDLRPGD